MPKVKPKRVAGRPRTEIDYDLIKSMASEHCTIEEIGSALGMTRQGLYKRKLSDPQLVDALEKGYDLGKVSLRRLQWESAKNGDKTMQIWLGKQILGQRDRQDINQTGPISVEIVRPK